MLNVVIMSKPIAIIITPNWRDYAEKYLGACIASIRAQDYPAEHQVFITDNESSEASVALLKRLAPEAVIVTNRTNDGFAKGVNDSIRAALAAGFEYIAVFNIHTVLESNCVSEMVKALESDEKIGVVQSLMLLPHESSPSPPSKGEFVVDSPLEGSTRPGRGRGDRLISSAGNATHFLGFGYCEKYREPISSLEIGNWKLEIFYPSGSSMLFRRSALEEVGLLDEEYWMYNEDQEIGWRLRLAGWKCVLAPAAVLTNKYEFQRSIKKYYWMDRNRIISILICYKWPTLLLILPPFILMEFGLVLFALKGGWLRDKLRVWRYFLQPRTWAYLHTVRNRNQRLRRVGDREIARLISGRIWYQEVDDFIGMSLKR